MTTRQTDALLVIDVQHDFLPGGPLAVDKGDEVVIPIVASMSRFDTVVVTQDWHPPGHVSFATTHDRPALTTIQIPGGEQVLWPEHCLAGTPGAELHPEIASAAARLASVALILRKGTHVAVDSYSAFRENFDSEGERHHTGLGDFLAARGIGRVFVVGLARDFCVAWTAIDAVAEGFEAVVVNSCTRAVFPRERHRTDTQFEDAGVRVIERFTDA